MWTLEYALPCPGNHPNSVIGGIDCSASHIVHLPDTLVFSLSLIASVNVRVRIQLSFSLPAVTPLTCARILGCFLVGVIIKFKQTMCGVMVPPWDPGDRLNNGIIARDFAVFL